MGSVPSVPAERDADRLYLTYQIDSPDVTATAEAIRVEQTIEFPHELAQEWIQVTIVGQIEGVEGDHVTFSYDPRILDGEGGLTQLLNVVWGNVSLMDGVRVVGFEPPRNLLEALPGPQFGVAGVRELVGAKQRPMLMTAIKPIGTRSDVLASHAALLAEAGIDIIKDDHGLANQPWAPWLERVAQCSAAVAESNARSGRNALYAPSLNVPLDRAVEYAHTAKGLGAGALLVLPGISSFELIRVLAADTSLGLPLISHPAGLGGLTVSRTHGFEPGLVYGLLNRLAGADLSVFVSAGGRFGPTVQQCRRIAHESRRHLPSISATIPVPGGGMSLSRVGDLFDLYGPDSAYLVGGALHRGDLKANAEALRTAVERLA